MARHKIISNRRKAKGKANLWEDILWLFDLGIDVVIDIYIFLMIVVLPFYFTGGYAKIGTDKSHFFYKVTCVTGLFFLLFFLGYIIVKGIILNKEGGVVRIKQQLIMIIKQLSVTDWLVLGYGAVAILSFLFSDYKVGTTHGDAWIGVKQWFLGLRTQLLLTGVYFAVSRFWKKRWMLILWLPVGFVTFVLGYLNRFGIRPLEMKNATIEFISTIGNINWYCGYIVIILFGGLYYYCNVTEKSKKVNTILFLWIFMGFATLVTQGSRSGLVALAGMLLALYLVSMKDEGKMLLFWECCISLGLACVMTYCVRSIWQERFNYSDGLVDLITNSPLVLAMLGGALLMYFVVLFFKKKGKSTVKVFSLLGYILCMIAGVALTGFIVLGVVNTVYPGSLGILSKSSALTFNLEWGSYRGATWAAGFQCFADQDLIGKLLGVGPDSMALYLHSGANVELLAMIKECFGNLLLTNAHNEWLTVLVNTGLLGVVCYAGLFLTAIVRFIKAGSRKPLIGTCGFAILAYVINNAFSFQQAMSAVTVFIVLGMGEALLREGVQRK